MKLSFGQSHRSSGATSSFVVALMLLSLLALGASAAGGSAQAGVPVVGGGDPMLPDGFRIADYLCCGAPEKDGNTEGPRVILTAGRPHVFPGVAGSLASCVFDAKQVEIQLDNLDPAKEYVLGFAWWDADDAGRMQSVRFGVGDPVAWTTVLPAAKALAYDEGKPVPARVLLPLAGAFAGQKQMRVGFVRGQGPNAVLGQAWLLEKTAAEARKRVLIVTGDDYPGHLWRETAPALAEELRKDARLEVSINECPAVLGSPLLDYYDAVVVHFKNYDERLPLANETGEGLARYAALGKGVMLTHFGCGAFQPWPGFVKIAGRVWNPAMRAHDPFGEFTVRVADKDHPVTAGLADFQASDELYTCLDGDTPIRVLCNAVSVVDKKTYPMAFTVEEGGMRVFHCTLGHDGKAYRNTGTGELCRRAAAWAAGLDPLVK